MAEDVLEKCRESALLERLPPSETADFKLVGAPAVGQGRASLTGTPGLDASGTEADWVAGLPGAQTELAPGLDVAMLRFAARYEYVRRVAAMLSRRPRLLFLDAVLTPQ